MPLPVPQEIKLPVGKVTWTANGEWENNRTYERNCIIVYKGDIYVTLRAVEAGTVPTDNGVDYRLLIHGAIRPALLESGGVYNGNTVSLNGRKVLFENPVTQFSLTTNNEKGFECRFYFSAGAGLTIDVGTPAEGNAIIEEGQKYILYIWSDANSFYRKAVKV